MHYIITIGLSSFLLFLIQPLITKQILPHYGGGSSIWTTNLFFFQTLLLIGYGYANYLQTKVKFKIGKTVHIVFLIISSIVLLFIPNQIYTLQNLFISQILTLVSLIGLPYLVLSATSPLIQSYFNQTKSQLRTCLKTKFNLNDIAT